jgi:hypothetical protein
MIHLSFYGHILYDPGSSNAQYIIPVSSGLGKGSDNFTVFAAVKDENSAQALAIYYISARLGAAYFFGADHRF